MHVKSVLKELYILPLMKKMPLIVAEGVQWLSGREVDWSPWCHVFEPHRRYCDVSLSKTHLSLLSTG